MQTWKQVCKFTYSTECMQCIARIFDKLQIHTFVIGLIWRVFASQPILNSILIKCEGNSCCLKKNLMYVEGCAISVGTVLVLWRWPTFERHSWYVTRMKMYLWNGRLEQNQIISSTIPLPLDLQYMPLMQSKHLCLNCTLHVVTMIYNMICEWIIGRCAS